MRFSVITPSFRNSEWLKLCIASVADQGVDLEHIVQDSCSDDGTQDWLLKDGRVKAFVEKDSGMYDAVNRGLRRSKGEILSYLNCDEQYLPGALKAMDKFFKEHPEVDVVFGDFVVVDGDGNYLFHRKVQTPLLNHTWVSHLQTFTCATFFRRSVIDEQKVFFDPTLRDVGDGDWMLRLLQRKTPMAVMRQFTSSFTMTGENMSSKPNARKEAARMHGSAPGWVQMAKPLIILQHRLRRFMGGVYSQAPFSFEIYTSKSPGTRVRHEVTKPEYKWKA